MLGHFENTTQAGVLSFEISRWDEKAVSGMFLRTFFQQPQCHSYGTQVSGHDYRWLFHEARETTLGASRKRAAKLLSWRRSRATPLDRYSARPRARHVVFGLTRQEEAKSASVDDYSPNSGTGLKPLQVQTRQGHRPSKGAGPFKTASGPTCEGQKNEL